MRELEGVNVARQAPFINYVDNGKYANQDGLYWEVTVRKDITLQWEITVIKVLTVVSGASYLKKI